MSAQPLNDETSVDPFVRRLREICLARAGIDVRFHSGMPAIRRAMAQLDVMPASERLAVVNRITAPVTLPAVSASVTRVIIPPAATSGAARERVDRLSEEGALIRVSPRALRRLCVVNRSVAVVDLSTGVAARDAEAVRICNADIIRAVIGHFEELWHSAVSLAGEGPVTLDRFTDRQRRVLELLAEGMTDEMVSRELSVSTRSVRTEVAIIREILGASSRFEAGMRYAEIRRN